MILSPKNPFHGIQVFRLSDSQSMQKRKRYPQPETVITDASANQRAPFQTTMGKVASPNQFLLTLFVSRVIFVLNV
jgi:hypothetical protein